MLASLFDLADNGILSINEREKQGRVFPGMSKTDTWITINRQAWTEKKPTLLPYENMLLSFLFDDLANARDELNLSTLKKKKTKIMTFFIASLFIMHHTSQGKKVFRQWKKIRKLLKRAHKEPLKNNPGNEVLARYVIYGVALGLGSYHMRRFLRQLDRQGYHGYLPWMIMHHDSNRSYGDVISKIVTSTATTMSSATGAGGGGSMGGGGGGAR